MSLLEPTIDRATTNLPAKGAQSVIRVRQTGIEKSQV